MSESGNQVLVVDSQRAAWIVDAEHVVSPIVTRSPPNGTYPLRIALQVVDECGTDGSAGGVQGVGPLFLLLL